MVPVSQELSARQWRALLLYSGSLSHDRGMTTLLVRFLVLPGKLKRVFDAEGECGLSRVLDAYHLRVVTATEGERQWIVISARFLKPLRELQREQQSARSKSWSRRPSRKSGIAVSDRASA